MKTWSITEARAHMAGLCEAALTEGPQRIERRDHEPVVIVAESDWKRLVAAYPEMADLILNAPFGPDDLPQRRPTRVLRETS